MFKLAAALRPLSLAAAVLAASPVLAAPIGVEINDLDLNSKAGKSELSHRIDKAAEAFCLGQRDTGSILTAPSCKAAVKEEITQKLAARISAARMAAAR